MASGFQNMGKIPELRKRILYTLILLSVYRIGVFVTTPGVNASVMSDTTVLLSMRIGRASAARSVPG